MSIANQKKTKMGANLNLKIGANANTNANPAVYRCLNVENGDEMLIVQMETKEAKWTIGNLIKWPITKVGGYVGSLVFTIFMKTWVKKIMAKIGIV